jgi:hypothetical protein
MPIALLMKLVKLSREVWLLLGLIDSNTRITVGLLFVLGFSQLNINEVLLIKV